MRKAVWAHTGNGGELCDGEIARQVLLYVIDDPLQTATRQTASVDMLQMWGLRNFPMSTIGVECPQTLAGTRAHRLDGLTPVIVVTTH